MMFATAVVCCFDCLIGHRFALRLKASTGRLEFELPFGSGAYVHMVTQYLASADWTAWGRALARCGSLEPIGTIELDEVAVSHLTRFPVIRPDPLGPKGFAVSGSYKAEP